MTKAGLLYHDMSQLLKNKNNAHIMANYSRFAIPQAEESKKQYTACDLKRDDRARLFYNITD